MNNSGEGIFLELNLRKVKWLLFGGYNHKKSNIIFFLKELGPLLDHYMAKFDHLLILGDFNSEITEDDMSEFCDIYHLKNLINEPTCYKNIHNPSNIDVMLTNKSRNFQHSQTIVTGLSDFHKMTLTVLKMFVKKQAPIYIKYRDYKNYDSVVFHTELSSKLKEVSPEYLGYDIFQNIFMNVLNKYAKVKKRYIRANNAPFMTRPLIKAIMNRSRFKNRLLKHPNKENELRYKKQRNYCVKLLKREKKAYFSSLNINSISNSKMFWKTIKPFFSEKNVTNNKIILVEDENIISDDTKVGDIMNTYFSNVVSQLDIQGYKNNKYTHITEFDELLNTVNKFKSHPSIKKIKQNIQITESFFFTIPNIPQTQIEIDKLNKNKPTTENNIPSKILKTNSDICAPVITNIYCQSINKGIFPLYLKQAEITPCHKKGTTTLKENYRPVSILPTVSKIFERNMYNDINNYMAQYLSPYLCGFRKGYSTQHCLMAMIDSWSKALDKLDNAAAILTDLSKAFDCINHELLIAKLDAYGFSHSALILVHNYL